MEKQQQFKLTFVPYTVVSDSAFQIKISEVRLDLFDINPDWDLLFNLAGKETLLTSPDIVTLTEFFLKL